jgi:MATE family multidrug resistance protein
VNWKKHINQTFKLSIPMIAGQLGQIGTNISDNIMIGNSGADQIAASSVANGIFIFFLVVGIGFAFATTPIVANFPKTTHHEEKTSILKNSFVINISIGFLLFLLVFGSSFLLDNLGQEAHIVALASPYLQLQAISVLPLMLYLTFKQFFEGLEDTKTAMVITLSANIVNIGLNYILIYGHFGFDAMGLYGAGLATLIARIMMAALIIGYFLFSKKYQLYKTLFSKVKILTSEIKNLFRLGLPIGLQFAFEVSSFAGAGIMCGWIGDIALGAHQIALSIASISWSIATGFGAAVTIRVSQFWGQKSIPDISKSYLSGYIITSAWMIFSGAIFLLFDRELTSLYVEQEHIIYLATSLLFVAVLFQLSDGAQVVGLSALRGFQDVKIPTILTLIAYWVIGLPIGYILAFPMDYGVHGVWYGLFIGLSISALFLYLRIWYLQKKMKINSI